MPAAGPFGSGQKSRSQAGMQCLQCGKSVPLLKRLAGSEFCSDAHRSEYQREFSQLALGRLLQSKPAEAEAQAQPRTAALLTPTAATPAAAVPTQTSPKTAPAAATPPKTPQPSPVSRA